MLRGVQTNWTEDGGQNVQAGSACWWRQRVTRTLYPALWCEDVKPEGQAMVRCMGGPVEGRR